MVHVTQIPDPYHAEWYEVNGTVIGWLAQGDPGDDEVMIVKVKSWRPAEQPYRDGGWIQTDSVRFPLIVLRWVGNDYYVAGGKEEVEIGDIVSFSTNRREQDDYAAAILA